MCLSLSNGSLSEQLLMVFFFSSFQGNYKMVPVSTAQRSDSPVRSKPLKCVCSFLKSSEKNLNSMKNWFLGCCFYDVQVIGALCLTFSLT